uniref:Uncharacterized protein n=1 Tax=Romanomermis culicivorax TaxID=13658 RepID=A0A915K4T4_ROMCU
MLYDSCIFWPMVSDIGHGPIPSSMHWHWPIGRSQRLKVLSPNLTFVCVAVSSAVVVVEFINGAAVGSPPRKKLAHRLATAETPQRTALPAQ